MGDAGADLRGQGLNHQLPGQGLNHQLSPNFEDGINSGVSGVSWDGSCCGVGLCGIRDWLLFLALATSMVRVIHLIKLLSG